MGIRPNYVDRQYVTFEGIDELPRQIFDILLEQEDLFRLINYDDGTPLDPSNPNLTFKEKTALIFKRVQQDNARVYFSSFTDNVEDNEQTQLRIYIRSMSPIQDNIAEINFNVDVITHNNLVSLDSGGNRLLKMIPLVVKTLNGYLGTESVGQLQIPLNGNIPLLYYNKHFQGYTIPIRTRFTNVTNCQTI